MTRRWNNRLMWSGEVPLNYPGLNPVAYTRFEPAIGPGVIYKDEISNSRLWEMFTSTPADNAQGPGPWGNYLNMSINQPAASQTRLTMPYFSGLWPGGQGKLLMGMWVKQKYAMQFSPLMSTRGTPGESPLAYLSAYKDGRPRHQVYNSAGTILEDTWDAPAWSGTFGWQWLGQYVDLGAQTSQIVSVAPGELTPFIGPVTDLAGQANGSCRANLDINSLQHASYWTSASVDEVMVAHPGNGFDLEQFMQTLAYGDSANARGEDANERLVVTDARVTASQSQTFDTGAEEVQWLLSPTFVDLPSGAVPYFSSNGGSTWQTGTLPAPFTGLLRWRIPLSTGQTFDGIDLITPVVPDPPTLEPLQDIVLEQDESTTLPLDFTITGTQAWDLQSSGSVSASRVGSTLVIDAGQDIGDHTVTVTLTDEYLQSATRTLVVQVISSIPDPPDPPTLDPLPNVVLEQNTSVTLPLDFTIEGPEAWTVQSSGTLVVNRVGNSLVVGAGQEVGDQVVTVTLTDEYLQLATRTFMVAVIPASPDPPNQPTRPTKRSGKFFTQKLYGERGFVTAVSLRLIARDLPEGASISVTDVQLQAGADPSGYGPNPEQIDIHARGRHYVNGTINYDGPIMVLANMLTATVTKVNILDADGKVRVGQYHFGKVNGSAEVDGEESTATQGWGRAPIITERSDLQVDTTVEGRTHIRMAWEDRGDE